MKIFNLLIIATLTFTCCSSDNSATDKSPKAKNNRKAKIVAVEGYIAKSHIAAQSFTTMATLEPMNSVSLASATSGRLIKLYISDGQVVQKGALLAKIDDSELNAQLKQSNANLQLAKQKEERTRKLLESGGATTQDIESAEASLKTAEASNELIQAQIAKTEVRAPFAGKLGFVNVSEGAWLNAGSEIATLSEIKKLKAKFSLPQRYASLLKVGDSVTFNDEERSVKKSGKVYALDATLSVSSRTRKIMVTLDNSKGEFLAGAYAKVCVPINVSQSSIPVPAEAFTLDKDGAYVFVAANGKAHIRHVTTGLRTPISVDVLSGLDEGDTVITSGLISLREGVNIRIREIRGNTDYEVE